MFSEAFHNIVNSALPMLIIFIVVICTVRISYIRSTNQKIILHNEIFNLLFIIYVLLLFELLTGTENSYGSGINNIPFKEIMRYEFGSKMFIYNVLGNILIFVPFGYFISRYVKPKKIFPIIVDALITSVTVETVQLKIGRSFDIDDIILNIAGAIIGYFVYIAFDAIYKHLPKILQKDFIYDVISLIILTIFILYAANILDLRWF
ncbi:MAG: VanZ family protein [Bacilli bacterium]|nr:VanZ family protein [Bacilli bacterium]